jgi:SAM-dependent methyltransferase
MASPSQAPPVVPDLDRDRIQRWRQSWDDVMARFMPGLASFEAAMITTAEAVGGGPPADVLDLGGGPGLLAERLATRWPRATVRMLDLDPVLLMLAETGTPAGVTVHPGDLAGSAWPAEMAQYCPVDLVTIAMTMHYLPADRARALYRDARTVLRPGGLLVVADLMPNGDLPSVMNALRPVADEAAAGLAWTRWWDEIGADPAFASRMRQRQELFADRPPAEFAPDERWHRAAAHAAGFRENGVIWRHGAHAAICAVV